MWGWHVPIPLSWWRPWGWPWAGRGSCWFARAVASPSAACSPVNTHWRDCFSCLSLVVMSTLWRHLRHTLATWLPSVRLEASGMHVDWSGEPFDFCICIGWNIRFQLSDTHLNHCWVNPVANSACKIFWLRGVFEQILLRVSSLALESTVVFSFGIVDRVSRRASSQGLLFDRVNPLQDHHLPGPPTRRRQILTQYLHISFKRWNNVESNVWEIEF